MNLTDKQKQVLSKWMADGIGLSEIQKKLADEMELRLSFMELRFLIDDLGIEIVDQKKRPAEKAAPSGVVAARGEVFDLDEETAHSAEVSVEVDRVVQPGAVASGKVTFPDGKTIPWTIDQRGRLMLQSPDKSYKPSQQDIEAFQRELQRKLERSGY